jgi:hypothetical protein
MPDTTSDRSGEASTVGAGVNAFRVRIARPTAASGRNVVRRRPVNAASVRKYGDSVQTTSATAAPAMPAAELQRLPAAVADDVLKAAGGLGVPCRSR